MSTAKASPLVNQAVLDELLFKRFQIVRPKLDDFQGNLVLKLRLACQLENHLFPIVGMDAVKRTVCLLSLDRQLLVIGKAA